MYKNYVLDTNVLIENPQCIRALRNGQENRIILPYTVLCELDRLKREPRVAHIVAQAVTVLQNDPEIQFLPPRVFPDDDTRTNDDRILDELKDSHVDEPVLVTNDRILQLKARIHAIASESYRDSNPFRSESQSFTGFVRDGEEPVPNSFSWVNGQPLMHAASGPRFIDYQHCV
jgi:PhoH-like ATPase